ncbi:hypothetical protein WSM22_32630 [Cytophagales bacterium WSM2-2]|nr:hypothetical protein WSM22_32630 [Cytophagales bacterium WSM2-2]
MKKLIVLIVLNALFFAANSQTMDQITEKRAREMHRVLSLNDKEQWKKFIQENYSKTLIEKPMRSKKTTSDAEGSATETKEIKGTLEEKVNIFQRLHDDFAGSKIASVKPMGENLEMILNIGELTGTFKLKFNKEKPHLIEGLGIEVDSGGK